MKSKKAKRGRPVVGERKKLYPVYLEPAQAKAIRAEYGGPDGSLTIAVRAMHAQLSR